MEQPKNTGLILEPIIEGKDGLLGSSVQYALKGEIKRPDGQWDGLDLIEEEQSRPHFDTFSCVSFGSTNHVEDYLFYVYGITVNYSDRALAVMSETKPNGNTPQKVYETIRKKGLVFEAEWPWNDDIPSWEEYMKELPSFIWTKALLWVSEWKFWHDYVPNTPEAMKEALKESPLAGSVALMRGDDGVYFRPDGWEDTHWLEIDGYYENGDWKVWDSYVPFKKRVRADFKFGQVKAIRIDRYTKKDLGLFLQVAAGIIEYIVKAVAALKKNLPNIIPPPAYEVPPSELPMNKPDYIRLFAQAIKDFEGFEPGSISFRNNNPGNIKGRDGNFLKFKTYPEGFAYLMEYLKRACKGKHPAYKPTFTIKQFIMVYAPPVENSEASINNYAAHIIKRLDISPETQLKDLV